jgi:hypothetical protein
MLLLDVVFMRKQIRLNPSARALLFASQTRVGTSIRLAHGAIGFVFCEPRYPMYISSLTWEIFVVMFDECSHC